jgi:hypothetical protein
MKVSRRAFILSGLLSVSGLLYWKTHTVVADDIESFFSNYESAIPIEGILNTNIQIFLFEEKLLSMLASLGVVKTIAVVDQMIKDEYQLGKIQLMNGWIVSETESKVLILRKKHV